MLQYSFIPFKDWPLLSQEGRVTSCVGQCAYIWGRIERTAATKYGYIDRYAWIYFFTAYSEDIISFFEKLQTCNSLSEANGQWFIKEIPCQIILLLYRVGEITAPPYEIFSARQNIRDWSRKLTLTTDHVLKYEDLIWRLKYFTYFFLVPRS